MLLVLGINRLNVGNPQKTKLFLHPPPTPKKKKKGKDDSLLLPKLYNKQL